MRKLIITGLMRSGTTFLANFLNVQDESIVYRDLLIPIFRSSPLLKIKDILQPLTTRQKNLLLSNIKAEAMEIGWNPIQDIVPADFNNLKEILDKSLEALSQPNIKTIGVKVTEIDIWIKPLLDNTDISIIYIYRDPRDVLLSSKNRFVDYDMYQFGKKYKNSLSQILNINHPNLHLVKYEDLILNPEKEAISLSRFLKIQIKIHVDNLKDRNQPEWSNNSAFHDVKKLFDQNAVYRWKKSSDEEIPYINTCYKDLVKKLGYDNSTNSNFKYKILNLKFYRFLFKIIRKIIRIIIK